MVLHAKFVLNLQTVVLLDLFRFNALQEPMAKRRQKLEDSLRWHQFNFDVDSELQWIQDHKPAATSTDYGKNLTDAENLAKNHKVILG